MRFAGNHADNFTGGGDDLVIGLEGTLALDIPDRTNFHTT